MYNGTVAGSACQQETSYTNEITENGEMKMAMIIDTLHRVFTLQTKHSTYQMKADELGVLLHTYYGEKTDHSDKGIFRKPL